MSNAIFQQQQLQKNKKKDDDKKIYWINRIVGSSMGKFGEKMVKIESV